MQSGTLDFQPLLPIISYPLQLLDYNLMSHDLISGRIRHLEHLGTHFFTAFLLSCICPVFIDAIGYKLE